MSIELVYHFHLCPGRLLFLLQNIWLKDHTNGELLKDRMDLVFEFEIHRVILFLHISGHCKKLALACKNISMSV